MEAGGGVKLHTQWMRERGDGERERKRGCGWRGKMTKERERGKW